MRETLIFLFSICLVAALAVGAPSEVETSLESVVHEIEASHAAELETAKKNLADALKVKTKADGELKEAENNLAWARDNMRENLISQYKKDVAKARLSVNTAKKGISAAQKQVLNVEKTISNAKDEAARKARAEAEAKAAEEKRAQEEAERKARAEAKAKADEEKKAKKEAERKAAADEKEKAIADEKALLESREKALSAKYAETYSKAVGSFNAAGTKVLEAHRAVAAARAKYNKIRNNDASTNKQKDAARAGIVFAENQLKSAENEYDKAQSAVAEVQASISRIEKDVRREYADELRAQGRKPFTYSTGFLRL